MHIDGGRLRSVLASAISLAGASVVMMTMVLMNTLEALDAKELGPTVSSFEVRKTPPPKTTKRKPKPKKKKKSRRPAAPLPSLGVSLSGLDFGLPGLGDALSDATTRLIGDVDDVVMTEDAVDEVPRATARSAAPYPARARAKGIEGFVTVSMLIDATGAAKDMQVLEANPPGVFDAAATAALRTWRFDPAIYEGRPVAVRVRQTLRFALE